MNGRHRAGRQNGALNALLPAVFTESPNVLKVAKLRLVDCRLGADRQRVADLRDNDSDLAGRNLHHRQARNRIEGPKLEPQTRWQQRGLISGLALKGDRTAMVQLFPTDPLADESDLGRSNGPQGLPVNEQDRNGGYRQKSKCCEQPEYLVHCVAPSGP